MWNLNQAQNQALNMVRNKLKICHKLYLTIWKTQELNISRKKIAVGTSQQPSKLSNPVLVVDSNTTITPATSARSLGILFDNHLSSENQITALSKACFYHIRDLRRIRDTLNFSTSCTIATSLVHSKLGYCNSLYYNLPAYQIDRIQSIQNCLARTVCRTSKWSNITHTLKSLHWLKVKERIEYKILSLTYNSLQIHQPSYLSDLLTIQWQYWRRSFSVFSRELNGSSENAQKKDRRKYCVYRFNDVMSLWQRYIVMQIMWRHTRSNTVSDALVSYSSIPITRLHL